MAKSDSKKRAELMAKEWKKSRSSTRSLNDLIGMGLLHNQELGGWIDAFEDTTFFHRVIRLGVELAWSLQRLVIIFLVVPSPVGALDRIHLVVVVARALAPKVITIVTPPIPTFSVVTVVGATMLPVVKTTMTVVPSRRLVGTSRIVPNELFYIIDVGVIFGRGKEFSHRGRPFAQ